MEPTEAHKQNPDEPLQTPAADAADVPSEAVAAMPASPSQGTLPLPDAALEPIAPAAAVPPAEIMPPAGFVRRAIAFLIDFILIEFLYLVPASFGLLGIYFSKGGDVSADFVEPFIAIWVVLFIGYFSFFHAQSGQTPAKRIMRIKVINKDGDCLSHSISLFRSLGYLFSFGFLGGAGFLMAIFGKKKRALHDFITGSQVILSD